MSASGMTTSDVIAICNVLAAIIVGGAIVFATLRGPVVATRQADERRAIAEIHTSKMWVFRQMMGHRYDVMHPNFVGALNLIQIEFSDQPDVLDVFSDFIDAFHERHTARTDAAGYRAGAVVRLLTAVGASLGYDLEQLDLMEKVYSPQGWANIAGQQEKIRRLLVDIADGKRFLPVLNIVPDTFVESVGEGKSAIRTKQTR